MKKMLFAFICLIMSVSISAQLQSSNTIFTNGDKINIELSGESEYFYHHEIQKGQSLYALSKIFKVSLTKLYSINLLEEGETIGVGQRIKIPINNDLLYKGVNLKGLKSGHYIPVYYETKAKDNLFRISRIYFSQPTADLIKRNKLEGNALALGQNILIGWLAINRNFPELQTEEFEEEFESLEAEPELSGSIPGDNLDRENTDAEMEIEMSMDSILQVQEHPADFNLSLLGSLKYTKSMKEVKKSQVANWDKTMPDNGMVYVLHKDAIIDSYLEMYNPILKRSVRAKVIGRIPYGAYTKDVCLVLSPRTAKQLGALDNRFKVEVKILIDEKK